MDVDDPEALVQAYLENEHGYLSWLGTRVEDIDAGRVVMTIPFDETLVNPGSGDPPTIHGGVAATLMDTAGGLAQQTLLDDPFSGGVATVNLNVNYLLPATGSLTATAEVVRQGGTIGVTDLAVESTNRGGEFGTVAVGQGAYRIFR